MRRLGVAIVVAGLLAGCAGPSNTPFSLRVEPDFIQGVIPGERLVLLVEITDGASDGPVSLDAESASGIVEIQPGTIRSGEVAEVTVTIDPTLHDDDVPFSVTVIGRRGSIDERYEASSVIVPWQDTIEPTAREIFDVFLGYLAEHHPDLGIGPNSVFEGTVVAPMLLVVTHYCFLSEQWEAGLAWHVMIAPDDWATLYFRPRSEMSPTRAFRLASWSTALNAGVIEIDEVVPPEQVQR